MSSNGAGTIGNYKSPAAKSTISGKGPNSSKESAGVGSGLSSYETFDSNMGGPSMDYQRDPMTGNATERITKNPSSTTAKKNGNNFDIC